MATKTMPSWEEFLASAQEGRKSEWVDGEVLIMSPANLFHEALTVRLVAMLAAFCQSNPDWITFGSNAVFTMASGNWRCPDASLVMRSRFLGVEMLPARAEFAPDVAFEILSPSWSVSEAQSKRQDYLGSSVTQVWIDPEKRLIELIEPDQPLRFYQGHQPLVISRLADFRLIPEDLFKI
jgi:Uma2 family endonuclease